MASKRPCVLSGHFVRSDYDNWPNNNVQIVMASPLDVGRDFVLTLTANDAFRLGVLLLEKAHDIDRERIKQAANKSAEAI